MIGLCKYSGIIAWFYKFVEPSSNILEEHPGGNGGDLNIRMEIILLGIFLRPIACLSLRHYPGMLQTTTLIENRKKNTGMKPATNDIIYLYIYIYFYNYKHNYFYISNPFFPCKPSFNYQILTISHQEARTRPSLSQPSNSAGSCKINPRIETWGRNP